MAGPFKNTVIGILSLAVVSSLVATVYWRAAHRNDRETASSRGCSAAEATEKPCPMRLLFYGYVDKQPKSAFAVVDSEGISRPTDAVFLRAGGDISHDGKYVSFDNCSSSNRGIYVSRLDGSNVRMVTPLDSLVCVETRWSPDDKKISFTSFTDGFLHVVFIKGGRDLPLTRTYLGSGFHSWSPKGDEIVFERGRAGSRLLYTVDMGGDIKAVTSTKDLGNCESWAPDWSPDGRRIAFTSCDKRLFTVRPDGADLRQVGSSAYSPRWSTDGQWILFLSGPTLMRVRSDGELLTTIGILPYWGGPFSLGVVR
jgi:dipeptidyl aminopeptidase/acylaminoacyl peptidase